MTRGAGREIFLRWLSDLRRGEPVYSMLFRVLARSISTGSAAVTRSLSKTDAKTWLVEMAPLSSDLNSGRGALTSWQGTVTADAASEDSNFKSEHSTEGQQEFSKSSLCS